MHTYKNSYVNLPEELPEAAYGLYINLEGESAEAIAKALLAPAKKKIEVAVRYQGITKEFTLADFIKRLDLTDITGG